MGRSEGPGSFASVGKFAVVLQAEYATRRERILLAAILLLSLELLSKIY